MAYKILIPAIICISLAACGNKENKSKFEKVAAIEASSSSEITVATDSAAVTIMKQPDDVDRITIKNGQLEVQAQDCKQYTQALAKIIQVNGGHTSNYEFTQNKSLTNTQDFSTDSMYEVYNITPSARLTMRIPAANKDEFTQQVMALKGDIIIFKFNEQDVTQDYENALQTTTLMSNKKAKIDELDDAQAWANNNSTAKDLAYKNKYYWCNVDVAGQSYIQKIAMAKPMSHNTSTLLSMANAIKAGWYGISQIFIGILYIWPMILLIVIGVYSVKKYKKLSIKNHVPKPVA